MKSVTWEARMTARARMREQAAELLEAHCDCEMRGRSISAVFGGSRVNRCGFCGKPSGGEAWRR